MRYAYRAHCCGITLIQILIAMAMVVILATIAFPTYQNHIRQTRLDTAKAALLDNIKVLEQHYSNKASFKKNATTWADLAVSATAHFCIRFQGNPQGARADHFTLKAVALDKAFEPRVLVIDQDHKMLLCERSTSSCDDEKTFFANPGRVDKDCSSI